MTPAEQSSEGYARVDAGEPWVGEWQDWKDMPPVTTVWTQCPACGESVKLDASEDGRFITLSKLYAHDREKHPSRMDGS